MNEVVRRVMFSLLINGKGTLRLKKNNVPQLEDSEKGENPQSSINPLFSVSLNSVF